jgi:WD40 repeat protein
VLFDDEARPYLADFGIALSGGSDDEAADDVVALAAMIRPLLQEQSSLSGQLSILRRAANGEITTARDLVAAWRASRELVMPTPTPERARLRRVAAGETNPYVGLRTFDEADATRFFGRDHTIDEIVALLSSRPFVTIAGPSGAGKSSVVRAGVIPTLREQGALVTTMTPGTRPLYSLGIALRRIATEAQLTAAGEDPAALFSAVAAAAPTVLVVDQLEELWTQSVPDDRTQFVKLLEDTLTATPLRVVSTIRADFYDRPLGEPVLAPLVQKGSYALTALGPAELEAAITGPLARTGIAAEPGLVAQIVADVAGRPAPLPLLQFALASLYENRTTTTLTFAAYQRIGGVAGAIATAAEALYQQLTPAQQEHCRELFAALVTPGETATDDTRRRALRNELGHLDPELIERLSAARLLTADRDPATGEPTIEIAHEALLTNWPRLAKWTDDQRDQLRTRRVLRDDATAWDREARSAGYLYRGGRLDTALGHTGAMRLTVTEQAFLDTSVDQRRQEMSRERRRLRRTQGLLAATVALLVIALVAGSVAFVQRRRANDQADVATAQATAADLARMTAQSRADGDHAPDRAALLAVEAYRRNPTLEAAAAVQSVFAKQPKGLIGILSSAVGGTDWVNYGRSVIVARDGTDISIWSASTFRLLRTIPDHGFSQFPVALSGDDHYIASIAANPDRIVIYTTDDGRKAAELPLVAAPHDVRFDPSDPNRLAVSYKDGRFVIVHWPSGQTEVALRTAQDIGTVTFSADGKLIVTASHDGTLQVADAHTGLPVSGLLRVLPETPNVFFGLARASISPDGTLVAATTFSASAKVFRIRDGTVVSELQYQCAGLAGVQFVDNAHFVVSVCGGAEIHDVATGKRTRALTGPSGGAIFRMAVSPAGDALALVTGARNFQVWSLDGQGIGSSRSVPLPEGFTVKGLFLRYRLTLNADMTRMLVYDDRGSYLYDLTAPAPEPSSIQFAGPGFLSHVAFTRDGRTIYSLHVDSTGLSTVQLWDPETLRPKRSVAIPYTVIEIGVSPDLKSVAVEAGGFVEELLDIVDVYDFDSGERLHRFDGLRTLRPAPSIGSSYATGVSFSPDSKRLLMTGILSTVIADLSTGEQRLVWYDGESHAPASSALFDSTGTKILLGSANSGYKVLDASTLQQVASGFTGRIANRPQFNPTRPLVMTDGCCCEPLPANDPLLPLELWDATSGNDIGTTGWRLNCGTWYPNGKGFVGYQNRIEFWDLNPEQWVAAACRFAGRNLTEDEWKRFGPKDAYRETCP